MEVSAIIAVVGGVAFIVGLFGGGFEVKEIRFPKIRDWLRVVSVIVGLVFIGVSVWLQYLDPLRQAESTPKPGAEVATLDTPTVIPAAPTDTLTLEPTGTPTVEPPTPTFTITTMPIPKVTHTSTLVDTSPPVVVSTDPPNGATNVSRDLTSVSITFNEPMQDTGDLSSWGFPLSADSVVSYDSETWTFAFSRYTTEPLQPNTTITLTVNLNEPPGFVDIAGNKAPMYTFGFTTGD